MREILFRGKNIETGKWVTGYFVKMPDHGSEDCKYIIWLDNDPGFGEYVKPETVGQFTGMRDKNGVKIFEGDIVEGYYGFSDHLYKVEVYYCEDSAANLVKCADGFWDLFAMNEIEVIGNIHDNPELLEKANCD